MTRKVTISKNIKLCTHLKKIGNNCYKRIVLEKSMMKSKLRADEWNRQWPNNSTASCMI